jgi:hypothetical protein
MIGDQAYTDAKGVIVNGKMNADGSITDRTYAVDPQAQARKWEPDFT